MTVPAIILDLEERFEQNLDAYKKGKYNETQVRREFIDPAYNSRHDQMVDLVHQMLTLHKKLAEAKVPQTKTVLQRQI